MFKLSYRDIIGYIGQSPNVPNGSPVTSTPDAPWNSPEMAGYTGLPEQGTYFCPNTNCGSVNLFINVDKGMGYCNDCQGRFSLLQVQEGNSFPDRALPRGTGLLNTDQGSNSMPAAHDSTEYGSGSASKSWGSGNS